MKNKTEDFIIRASKLQNNKYDYSKVNYINNCTKVCIICPIHGEFWQTPKNHLKKCGCPKCSNIKNTEKQRSNTEEFIEKAKEIHGTKYDYSKVNYINAKTKVCIICPEHGEFWQIPYNHLLMNGCPECSRGKISKEYILKRKLKEYFKNINIVSEKRFKWLSKQRIDIFFENYNIGVEYQGIQHFEPVSIFGGDKALKRQQKNDIKKNKLCEKNGVKIFYFTYDKHNYTSPFNIINNFEELINEIEKVLKNE